MYILIFCLLFIILFLIFLIWKYQRQVLDICRQLEFLKEKDSNMLISREFDFGGIGRLCNILNEFLIMKRKERKYYLEKENIISQTYTNLSHDIRTPLTSLDGYVQLLEKSLQTEQENYKNIISQNIFIDELWEYKKEQERYVSIIEERIYSLKELLEEIFIFTKLKNESYQLELLPCCINRILKEIIFSYYEDWKRKDIEPELFITEEMLYFLGNIQAIKRVIQNIIKNGLDHGEKIIQISLQRDEDSFLLSICNQTVHLEEIEITQVFERFYKADKARSKNSTGLGLAIAKELVLYMKGTIEAQIKENWFCIFVKFPLIKN